MFCKEENLEDKNMKKLLAIAVAGILSLGLVACGSGSSGSNNTSSETKANTTETAGVAGTGDATSSDDKMTGSVSGSGSSALLPLAKDAAEKFKEKYPDVSVTLNGGGSGTGLKQVADGSVDIGNSDVAAEDKLDPTLATELVDHKVCAVTMAPIVNKEVAAQVKSLTKQQLIDIFTGKTLNWSEVGGPDEPIALVTRPATSGTRALFQEYALDGNEESTNASLETDDSGTLLQTVSSHTGAIGYVALSYLVNNDSVAPLAIDGVEPTLENTYNGTYPVWGYEHMYTKGEPEGAVKAYLEYIMSDEYGESMEQMGYNVTKKLTVER